MELKLQLRQPVDNKHVFLYQQTYWHRKSDGIYLKTNVSEEQYSELVKRITTLAHFENWTTAQMYLFNHFNPARKNNAE